jgi:hypothetical protein
MDAMNMLDAVLLPVVAGLLLEELTLGGLVRLLLAPRPKTSTCGAPRQGSANGNSSLSHGRYELKNRSKLGGARCSH